MPLADYATKFTSALRAYKTALMSTPCVCRQSAVEADVATVVLCDYRTDGLAEAGSPRGGESGHDSGYTQCVLAPREKAVAASAGDPREDDPSTMIDDEAILPAEGAALAAASLVWLSLPLLSLSPSALLS